MDYRDCMPRDYRQDPSFKMPQKFLSKEVYGEAILSFPIVCTDVVFTCDKAPETVFLAHRTILPAKHWWIFGGRIFAGESVYDAMVRHIKEDTSLDVGNGRLRFLGMHRYIWSERQQDPQNAGSDNLAYTWRLDLSESELETASKNLNPKEYVAEYGLRGFSRVDLKIANVHPAIVDLYNMIFPITLPRT